MASKRGNEPSADTEIDELFEGIDTRKAATNPAKPAASAKPKASDDILAELENELGEKAPSRPHTPRVREPTKPAKRTGTPSADTPAARASLEQPSSIRKSVESTRSPQTASSASAAPTSSGLQHESDKTKAPVEQSQSPPSATAATASAGGGWWGGILSTATAAMKQAEAAVKEIQQNEDAKKWAEQVRGNVGALKGLGTLHSVRNPFLGQYIRVTATAGCHCVRRDPRPTIGIPVVYNQI